MKILDYETEFDFDDADNVEKLENATEKAQKELLELNKEENLKGSEEIRKTCKIIFNCFNEIFGEDTDKKIFGNKTSFKLCVKAFSQICEEREKQSKEFEKEVADFNAKYGTERVNKVTRKKN